MIGRIVRAGNRLVGIPVVSPGGRDALSDSHFQPIVRDNVMKIVPVAALCLAVSGFCATAQAVEVEALDTWSVGVGSFALDLDADLRVDGTSADGGEISLSNDLGLDLDSGIGYFSVGWRPFEHHQFDFSYYGDDVSGSRTIDREIIIEDETFNIGATVDSKLGYDAYDLTYTCLLYTSRCV